MSQSSNVEFLTKIISVDEHMQAEVDRMQADGWLLVPEIKPVVIYQLHRVIKQPEQAAHHGFGQMAVDESKVHILRNGKVLS